MVACLLFGYLIQRLRKGQTKHVSHLPPVLDVPVDTFSIRRPTIRIARKGRRGTLVDPDEVPDKPHVEVDEGRTRRLADRFAERPEVQPHPNAALVELEVPSPLGRGTLRAVPRRHVRGAPVVDRLVESRPAVLVPDVAPVSFVWTHFEKRSP